METPNQKSEARGSVVSWVGGILAPLLALAVFAVFADVVHTFVKWNDREVMPLHSLDEVERRVSLPFPPGTVFVDGQALVGFGGEKLIARVKVRGKALPKFLVECAAYLNRRGEAGTSLATLSSEAKIITDVGKAAANPGKRLTSEEIDALDLNLMFPMEKAGGSARVWKLDQTRIRHVYQAEPMWNGASGLDITVNLDDPAVPLVYLVYVYI